MTFEIYPIFLGSIENSYARALKGCRDDRAIRTAYTCFFLSGQGRSIMVDTGPPPQADIAREGKPFRVIPDAVTLKDALSMRGLDPGSVTDIIFTHLHYDHVSNLALFPNARRVYVQTREVLSALAPEDDQALIYSATAACGTPAWTCAIGRLCLLDGDAEILPGLSVILTPGHSPGSQSVLVDTAEGAYLLTGDFISIQASFDWRMPGAILHSEEAWHKSYEKIAGLNAKLLPGHEMRVHERSRFG